MFGALAFAAPSTGVTLIPPPSSLPAVTLAELGLGASPGIVLCVTVRDVSTKPPSGVLRRHRASMNSRLEMGPIAVL